MFYIEFCAGQCKKRFTAYLSTASIHNYCSRKQANEFQRLLNIQPESIPSYKVKDATGKTQEIHEKIIFDGPQCSLTSEYLTFNDGRSIKINFQS